MQYYIRYEAGTVWTGGNPNYDKNVYMWENGPGSGEKSMLFQHGSGAFVILSGSADFSEITSNTPRSWSDVFGAPSNGLFHLFQLHIKFDTSGQSNGIAQAWIDGTKYIDISNATFNGMTGIKRFDFHSNQSALSTGRPTYVDYDDFEIYTTTPPGISPDGDPWIPPRNNFLGGS